MKYLFSLFLGALLGGIISCSSRSNLRDSVLNIEKNIRYADAIQMNKKYSDLFNDVKIIPFDTVGNFMIRDIKQMKFALDHFFLIDESQQLLVFDRQGKGRTKINRKGQGKDEYISIRGVDISLSDSLICLLTYPSKLMYFSLDGNFIKDIDVDFQGFEMALINEKAIAIYTDNVEMMGTEEKTLLKVQNLVTGEYEGYVDGYDFLVDRKIPAFQQRRVFTTLSSGEVLFFQPISNNIYSISQDNVSIKYRIDFEDKNPPINLAKQVSPTVSSIDFIQDCFSVYGFNSYWENDKYFYIQANINKQLTDLLFDKREQKLYAGLIKDDLTECQPKLLGATANYLVAYISAEDVITLIDYLNYQDIDISQMEVLNNISDFADNEGNPIAFMYFFQ